MTITTTTQRRYLVPAVGTAMAPVRPAAVLAAGWRVAPVAVLAAPQGATGPTGTDFHSTDLHSTGIAKFARSTGPETLRPPG